MGKQLDVPEDSKLARAVHSTVQEHREEKDDLKRFIMQYDPSTAAGPTSVGIKLRAGKGKGRSRNKEYVNSDFMPEEPPEEERIAPGTVIRMSGGKGGPRGGPTRIADPYGSRPAGYGDRYGDSPFGNSPSGK